MEERVQKILAQANYGSRRACEKIIEAGRVTVNGKIITIGDKADPKRDVIKVDGKRVKVDTNKIYVAVHKPLNVISTTEGHAKDDRPTVRDILPLDGHFFMVGRLDAESTGLVIMTNDGSLTNRLTHPRYRHTKTYRVQVHGLPPRQVLDEWENGVYLDGEKTAPCLVRVLRGSPNLTNLEIIMTEGKNRQIRRVASMLGYPVHKLQRTAIGRFELGALRENEYKILTKQDVNLLKTPSPDIKLIKGSDTKKRPFRRAKNKPDQSK